MHCDDLSYSCALTIPTDFVSYSELKQ
jgi:hypothetical protein